ncbi:hypothetical protein OHR68_27535 [Spirillospora sp. NBC_00431]
MCSHRRTKGDRAGRVWCCSATSRGGNSARRWDERRIALAERHRAAFGPDGPVLDAYAEGCYDGVHLLVALAVAGVLDARRAKGASARLLASAGGVGEAEVRRAWAGAPLGAPRTGGHLARRTAWTSG